MTSAQWFLNENQKAIISSVFIVFRFLTHLLSNKQQTIKTNLTTNQKYCDT